VVHEVVRSTISPQKIEGGQMYRYSDIIPKGSTNTLVSYNLSSPSHASTVKKSFSPSKYNQTKTVYRTAINNDINLNDITRISPTKMNP
jgi:hypothetical protein